MKKNLVVCDTNIWVNRLFAEIKVGDKYIHGYYENATQINNKFQELTNQGHTLVMTPTVYTELDKIKHDYYRYLLRKKNIYKRYPKAIKKRLNVRFRELSNKYSSKNITENKLSAEEYVQKVETFYGKYKNKLINITMKKALHFKWKKRISFIKEREKRNFLPEKIDIKILAECLQLKNLINKYENIGLFSDDSDFCDLKEEIENELNIKIYKI